MFQLKRLLALPMLLSILNTVGCTRYAPVPVLVRDAATKEPIGGAKVTARWLSVLDFFPPHPDTAVTDSNGRAVVRAAFHARPVISAMADGYSSNTRDVHGDYFAEPPSARRTSDLVIELSKPTYTSRP